MSARVAGRQFRVGHCRLPTADVGYTIAQFVGQLSRGEIAHHAVAARPKAGVYVRTRRGAPEVRSALMCMVPVWELNPDRPFSSRHDRLLEGPLYR